MYTVHWGHMQVGGLSECFILMCIIYLWPHRSTRFGCPHMWPGPSPISTLDVAHMRCNLYIYKMQFGCQDYTSENYHMPQVFVQSRDSSSNSSNRALYFSRVFRTELLAGSSKQTSVICRSSFFRAVPETDCRYISYKLSVQNEWTEIFSS